MRARLALALISTGLWACPDERGGPDDAVEGLPLGQLEGRQIQKLCELIFQCDPADQDRAAAKLIYRDVAECVAQVKSGTSFDLSDLQKAVAAKTIRYNGNAAEECLRGLTECSALELAEADQSEACRTVFVGLVAMGGACHRAEECSGESFCARTTTSTTSRCPGTCTPQKAIGAECTASTECQRTGLMGHRQCVYEGTPATGHCRDVKNGSDVGEGATCGLDLSTYAEAGCLPGLWCDGQPGVCKNKIPLGMACVPNQDLCLGAAECGTSPSGYTCQEVLIAREAGDGCDEIVTYCSPIDGLACLNRVCMASRPPGGPLGARCDRGDYAAPCDAGLYCGGQAGARTCRAKVALGARCVEFDACDDSACDLGVCRARECHAY